MLTKVKVFNMLGNSLILTLFGVFSVTRVRANTSSEQHYIHIIRYAREGKNRNFFCMRKKIFCMREKIFPRNRSQNFDCREFFRNFALKTKKQTDRK